MHFPFSSWILIVCFLAKNNEALNRTQCLLPSPCEIGKIHDLNELWANKKFSSSDVTGIKCDISSKGGKNTINYDSWLKI